MIGQTISHYKILAKIGEGGMGVVYRAQDAKLDRPVALKFLAQHLLQDEDGRKRFVREAKAAAALNHPNICTVHEIDEAEGRTFIAMAFIEGESLDRKIERGPLKLKNALDVAIQTAQGLQAAHEKGIVHRDIKPGNLMITGSGSKRRITIMDFGLAQLAERSKLTRADETMGTVAYMSPEQTMGAEIDHRSDIWALGVVIYEMVTGQQPFKGHYDKAVMYSITSEEPEPMTALRTGVPMELELLVNKCLAKDADERYQHTDELLLDLQGLRKKLESGRSTIMPAVSSASQPTAGTRTRYALPIHSGTEVSEHPLVKYRVIEDVKESDDAVKYLAEDTELHRSVAIRVLPQSSEQEIEHAQRRRQRGLLAATVAALCLAVVFGALWLFSPASATESPVWRFSISPENLAAGGSISPNGKYILYRTESEGDGVLWLRALDSETPRRLDGTEGVQAANFHTGGNWSPDSRTIVFGTDRELKRITVDGSAPATLCLLPEAGGQVPFLGASWSPDGSRIVFSSGFKLYVIPARGGEPNLFLELDESERTMGFIAPQFLPAGAASEGLLYTNVLSPADLRVWLLDLKTDEHRELTAGAGAVYSNTGHLIYHAGIPRNRSLRALPFSVENLAVAGEAFPIAEAGSWPTVADDGTLGYFVDTSASGAVPQLVWKDRAGKTLGKIGQPQAGLALTPRLSPDGRSVAVPGRESSQQDIWLHEVDRPVKSRLTFDESPDVHPTWLPSGDAIAFSSGRSGPRQLYLRRIDGNSPAEPLLKPDTSVRRWLTDWSHDGRLALFYQRPAGAPQGHDIWYLQRRDDGGGYDATPFLESPFTEITAGFSPDAKWVVYNSNETGRAEVYVRSFPDGGAKQQISINGGVKPRWSQAGEIFYVEDSTLMAVSVSTGPTLTVGQPRPLFSSQVLAAAGAIPTYDVTPDGQTFVLAEIAESEGTSGEANSGDGPRPFIRIVRNWYEGFRDRQQD